MMTEGPTCGVLSAFIAAAVVRIGRSDCNQMRQYVVNGPRTVYGGCQTVSPRVAAQHSTAQRRAVAIAEAGEGRNRS